MPNPNENRKWLYDKLTAKGVKMGTYEQFDKAIDDENNLKWVYDKANSQGLKVGDYNQFSGAMKRVSEQVPATAEKHATETVQPDATATQAVPETPATENVEEKPATKPAVPPKKPTLTDSYKVPEINTPFTQPERPDVPVPFAPETPVNSTEVKNTDEKAAAELREQTERDVQRYGAGNADYTFEEAVSAGKEYEKIAPEIAKYDERLKAFKDKYGPMEEIVKEVNDGKRKLTQEEYRKLQAQYPGYDKEAKALSELGKSYDAILATAPGREYQAVSKRMDEIGKGAKTPEAVLEYAQEFSKLQRNPLYRAQLGENAPSEDEIQSDWLQAQIAYFDEKMKTATGDEKKELKKAFSDAKEALYANPYYRKHLEGKVAENKEVSTLIGEELAKRRNELTAEWTAKNGGTPDAWSAQGFEQWVQGDQEMKNLYAAAHMVDDAIREYQKPTKYDDSKGLRNVGKGLADWAGNTDTWSFGVEQFAEDIGVVRPILEKVEKLAGSLDLEHLTDSAMEELEKQLTQGEQAVLLGYFEKIMAVAAKGADTSIGYQIGQGIGDMVNLGVEMALTGPVGGAVRKGIDKAGMAAMKKLLTKRMYRQFAKSGVGRVALWTGHKAVRDVFETAARIPFMPSTYKAIGEGAVELSSDYKTRDFWEYAPEKSFDNFVEQLTEVSNGFAFPLMGKVMKMRGMKNFVTSVIGKDSAKALRTFIERGDIKLLDDMMIGSFGGEWEEELLGAVIHSVTDDPNALRDFFSAEQQLVLLGTLAPIPLARGTVGGVQLAVPAAQAALAWNKAESELKRLGFDDGRIARLKEVVDNASAPEGARAIMQAMKDSGYSSRTREEWGFMEAAESPENDVLYGSVPEIDRDAYDALAHYYWRAQQKRAAGLMGEVEQDRKVRDKRAELKSKYGQFWHNEMGEEVVETGTIIGADGNPLNVFIASDEPMEDGRVAYVGEDGSNGFLSRDQLVGQNADGTFAPNPETTVTPINIYLAGLVMQDSQVQEAQGVVNEASAANTSLRDQIEGLADVKYKGQSGTITRADDDGAVFVPDDGENVRVTWADLAAENGIQVPMVETPSERTGDAAALVAEHTRLKQELAGAFRQANEEAGKNGRGALMETEEGTATVVNIISDTIDPENGTAQFTVRMPDGSMNVTMATAIEPVMSQLRGESAPEPEPEPAPAPAPAPGPQPPAGGAGGAELDFRGNPIPTRDGEIDEEAFRESDPEAWAAWNDALPEDDPRKATLGTKKRLEGLAKSSKSAADKAQKDLEKLYDKGATDKEIREKETEVRDQRARQKRYEDAIASIGKREMDKAEAEREAARKAAEAERLRREKEKEEEEKRKAGKAPDISEDTPEAAQKRGYIMVNGNRIDRPTPDAVAEKGKDTKIAFTKSVAVDGKYGLVEATRIEPSHVSDQENPLHFFAKKWQPKNRKRADSAVAIQQMANGIRPGEITRGETAYGGAPIVNERGEVIQGNGRSEALRRAYGQGTAAEYKAWLAEHAEEFGLTREQVEKMETPILVRVLDVDDARAEQLGKMEQKDLESGGDQRFNGKTLVKKMGKRFGEFLDYLFAGDLGDDATALDYINQNGYTALHWLHQNGFINDTEYANAQENGKLTEETVSAFRAMSIEPLFDNVPEKVRSGFEMLPNSVKLALQRSVATLYGLEGVIGDIQDALAYYCDFETADPAFKKAKNTEEAWNAVAAWMQNVRFDGTSEGEAHPSIVARRLASVFKGGVLVEGEKNPKRTEKAFRSLFTNIASTMRGEGGFMSAAEPTDNIGAYRENNVITEEEENQIRNGKNDNRPGPASGAGANGPVGGQGSGAVREGRPGGVPERKPAGEGAGPVAPKAPAAPAPEPSAPKTGYGANNTLVTNEDYEELKKQWAELMGEAGTLGIVPKTMTLKQQMKLVSLGAQMAAYHIEAGVRKFVDLSKRLLQDVGESIRPYLKALYKAARELPGIGEYVKDMNTDAEVDAIDVNTIGKEEEPVEEPAEEPAPAGQARVTPVSAKNFDPGSIDFDNNYVILHQTGSQNFDSILRDGLRVGNGLNGTTTLANRETLESILKAQADGRGHEGSDGLVILQIPKAWANGRDVRNLDQIDDILTERFGDSAIQTVPTDVITHAIATPKESAKAQIPVDTAEPAPSREAKTETRIEKFARENFTKIDKLSFEEQAEAFLIFRSIFKSKKGTEGRTRKIEDGFLEDSAMEYNVSERYAKFMIDHGGTVTFIDGNYLYSLAYDNGNISVQRYYEGKIEIPSPAETEDALGKNETQEIRDAVDAIVSGKDKRKRTINDSMPVDYKIAGKDVNSYIRDRYDKFKAPLEKRREELRKELVAYRDRVEEQAKKDILARNSHIKEDNPHLPDYVSEEADKRLKNDAKYNELDSQIKAIDNEIGNYQERRYNAVAAVSEIYAKTDVKPTEAQKPTTKDGWLRKMDDVYKELCNKFKVPEDPLVSGMKRYSFDYSATKGYTLDALEKYYEEYRKKLEDSVEPATEKQLAYIDRLADEQDKEILKGVTLNKVSAGYVISILKAAEDAISSKMSTVQEFEEYENELRRVAELNGKNENKPENTSESPEKSVTSQEENLEQGSLFGEPEPAPEEKTPVKVETKKEQGNGLQGNDGAVLPEGLPTDNRGPEGQPGEGSQRAGEGEGREAGGTDGGGQRDRAGDVRPDQPRPDDSVKKNTRNNRVSRGETVYPKTPAARYRANLAAIRLLKQIEQEGREATKEEMEVLRKFTGWGGLGSFFNNRRSLEYREISEVLTTDEIQAAENSINTAYYTPVEVIDAMWDIAKKLGFKGGRVLEGSAGIGNILASMPEAISNRSDIQAVELDPITGGILRLLYPDASVLIDGFENADIPNNSVDLAITNVPFGDDIRVYDEKEKDLTRKFGGRIHDFCIAKNIRKLKEGGIAIFITSRSTLDSASKTLRNWIVNEGGADVIGVFRLNNATFEGTGATSDIIVVRKRVNGEVSPDAINIQDTSIVRRETYETTDRNNETTEAKAAMEINDYFAEHPENMGGEMAFGFEKGDSYRPGSSALWPSDGVNQSERLEKWVSGFRQQVQMAKRETAEEPEQANAKKEGQLVLNSKGKLCISRRGQAVPLDVNDSKVAGYTKAQVVKDYDAIKTALDAVLRYQLDNATDEGLSPLLRKLNSAYDTFVSRYGYLNKNRSITFLRNDVDFPSIAALESYREKKDITGKVTVSVSKAPVFSGRVLGQKTTPTPKDVRDGVIVSMTQFGRIDIPFIAKALGRDEESVRKEALKSGLCFENPENGTVEVEYEYLSGNVREKLAYAESHNEDGKYDANIKALKEVIPRDIPAHLIEFSLGSDWLPVSLYTEYAKEKFGVNNDFIPQHFGGSWGVANENYGQRNDKNISGGVRSEKLGGLTKTGVDLMLAAMNKQTVKFSVTYKDTDGTKHTETDKEASQAAATKIDEMRDDFKEWCRKRMLNDKELSESIAKTYNDTFNAIAPKRISEIFSPEHFEGQVETMGGKPFHLYPHQSQAVVRATTQPLMMAHEVGTGKTFTLITTAMEMRRLGTAKKPMIVVQNATLGQFVSSAKALYPNAKILTISEKDRTREGRSEFYAKIKYNDWDMIIVPQSVFEMIPDSEKRKRDYIEAKIDEARHILAQATEAKNAAAKKRLEEEIKDLEYERDFGEKRPKKNSERDAKREAKVKNNAKARAKQQLDRKTDEVSDFDDMGIDALLVDEAHNYKRLGFSTSMAQGVKGVDPAYSKKSAGVYLKTRAVFDKAGWKNVVFATGTPISNTAAEIWTFMRYMMPDEMMRELHLYYFDDFVSNFGNISQSLEFTTSGKFKENSRFASYTNLPELIRIWSSVTDTVLTKDAVAAKADAGEEAEKLDDKVPVMESWTDDEGNVHENQARDIYLPQSPSLVRIMNAVRARLEWYESLTGKEKKQNSSVPLVMYGLAKMAAIDPRLVDRNAADEPQSKTNKAVEETLRALKDSERYKGTCALFSDNFRRVEKTADGKTVEAFNLFEEIKRKLVAAGVPEDQIVIIKNGMSVQAKEKIFAAVNAGDIRVIMGTTASLGTGVNIQERLFFEAHLDAPNRPMDYTQRMGRILRQGNLHKQWGIPVRVVRFGVEDSLDVTAYQRLSTKSKFINSIMDGRPLIENGMENRILEEEEEGVFDNPVAVLSGSQYAMLKSAAERELRKLRSKKEQHRQDQIYIESNLRYNEGAIKNIKDRIKESEKLLAAIEEKFPDGKISEIVIEGKKVSTAEEIAAALKEKIFEPLKAAAEQRKKFAESSEYAFERHAEGNKEFSIKINGVLVRVLANIKPEEDWRTRKVSISTTVRYQAMEIGVDEFSARKMPNGINGVKDIISDFIENVASGKLQRENIESYNDRIAKLEADNESMMARRGKPFADEDKLAEQEKLVEDLTQKMKDEMAEKEAKYASQAAGIDGSSFDLDVASESAEEEDSEEGDLYRTYDEPEVPEQNRNDGEGAYFRRLTDPVKIAELEKEEKVPVYRSALFVPDPNGNVEFDLLDGKGKQKGFLYPPMSVQVDGKFRDPLTPGDYDEAEERPDLATDDGHFTLVDDNGKEMDVLYAPYLHNRVTPLNEQFSAAYRRNLVVIKSEVPISELTSKYTAEKSKKSTGKHDWPSGTVSNALAKEGKETRKVILSRWAKIGEPVPYDKVADEIVALIGDRDLAFEYNVVSPGLRKELQKRGVRFEGWHGNKPKNVDEIIAGMQESVSRRGENLRNPIDRAAAIVKINEIANKLGVKFEEDPDLKAKGVFSPKTGKIRINIDAHRNTADLEATLLHEAVAHYGLRKLFGKDWKELRMRLYEQASPEIKARVDAIAKADGLSTEVAMEEYIAQLAEDGRFDEQEESFWQKIVTALKQLLAKIGINSGYLTDEDFRAMLYASYRNLQTGGALETAARVATAAALRRNAEASHEDNGPEDNGPGGGLPADTEEDMMGRGNDEVVREVSADLYDRYENQNGEDKPWMSENELIDRIEEELPYGIATKELFAKIDEYRRLDEEDFNEGRRDFSGSERDNVFREIMAELERLSKERPVRLAVSDSSVSREKNEIKARSQANGTFMKAPNGQPTNLTEDQWLTVRTKAFKDWFGDWENDPANASKVVDENGEPLVVYRVGQTKGYSVFDENRGGNWRGFYFTNRDAALKNYATANTTESQVRAFFVKSVNPFTENNFNVLQGDKSELVDMGHDGMIYAPDGIDARNFEVKVFNSNQIKSATENNGNFSNEDPDIYHRELSDLPESERDAIENEEIDQDTEEYYRRDRGYSEAKTADDMYDRKTSTVGSALYTAQVDEYAPLDAFQESISAEAKKELSENERVSNRLRELGGQAMNEVRTYNEKFLQPMWKAIADLRKAVRGADGKKLSMQELTRYVGLKSGLERNELFAKRDAKKDAKSYYDKEYDNRKAELATRENEEKARLKARLDEGIISDVTYQGELNALAIRIQQLKDKADADHQANIEHVDNETASEYRRLYGEYRQKDYSGLLSWFTEEADLKRSDYPSRKAYRRAVNAARKNYVAGVTDLASAEDMAKRMVDDIESRAGSQVIGNLWNRINAATKETLDFQYRKNMISRQQKADISASMKFYIPMRGFEDATAEDLYSYYMKPNVSGFAPTILAAKGRGTRYRSPFGMIGFMHSSAVSQGLKNEAKLELLDFVRRNPKNTVATVTRAWLVKTGETDADGKPIYEVAYPQVPEGATIDERERIIEDFETDMKERKERGEAYNAHREVQMNGGVVAFEKDAHRTEHIVRVMEGGREYGIVINGNPAAAQAVNGIKRQGGYENFLEIMRATRRVLSQMFTTLSVPFWVSNFQRDHGQGGINTFVRNNLGYVGKYIINRWELLPQMIPLVLSRAEQGGFIDRLSPKFAEYYRLYVENGGPMGQNRIETDVTFNRQLERYLRTQQNDKAYIKKGARALGNLLSAIGEGVETITRFATFVTSMEYGRPLHEAIADSKEVSTNFARKGHGRSISWEETGRMETRSGRQLGDTSGSTFETYRNYVDRALIVSSSAVLELLRAGIPFFNAAIQGIKNKTDNYRKNWVKALLADGTYFAIGFAMRYFMGGAGGDDDKEKYGHTSDYTRRNNFLTPLGEGRYHKWALSQEYRYMYALGDITAEAVLQEKPYDDLALDAFEALVQVLPAGAVDPSARGEAFWIDALKSVMPGVVTPIVEAFENKDFKGSRIYDEGFNGNKTDYPGWTKKIDTTGPGYVKAAEWLNKVSGGGEENATVRGSIDFNPAIVEHFVKSYLSGPYQIIGGVGAIVGKKVRGEKITSRDIPVWNRVFMNTNDNSRDAYYSGLYYYFKDRDKEARRLDTGMRGSQTQQAKDFRKSKDYAYMLIFKKYESNERALNQMKKAAQNAGNEDAVKNVELKTTGIRENIAKECLDVYFDRVDWKSWLEKTNSGNEN